MGKERNQAASVPWGDISAAIAANPQRGVALLQGGGAAGSIAALPVAQAVEWLPGWTEDTTASIADIVSFVLWIRDPMYRTATVGVRRAMEREEASALLQASEKAWRDHNGRLRGWVRKHLEEDLRQRSAGGDPAPDAWEATRVNRRAAHLVDYVCVMRNIRVSLWWPEHHATTVIGTGDRVVNLNATSGHVLLPTATAGWTVESSSWPALLTKAKEMTWQPAACAPSLGAMTVAQIQEALTAIQPDALKTGGRLVLWNRLQWARLERSLKGLPDPTETDALLAIAAPVQSE
jgi:hypothetical protein